MEHLPYVKMFWWFVEQARALGHEVYLSHPKQTKAISSARLKSDKVDAPMHDFCTKCNMCVKFCPGDAISDEKQDVRGILKWVVDTEKCAPYWGSHYACGICLMVCPVNARGVWTGR